MNFSPNSERIRIARELHDGLAQELASLGYRLDQIIGNSYLDNKNRYSLRELRFTLTGLINQVRDEIFELRTNSIKGLKQQVDDQISVLLSGSDIDYEVVGEIEIDSDKRFELIRAVREIIVNARRHSGCSHISINLSNEKIVISDNGLGGVTDKAHSYGLTGVQERLTQIGALLSYESNSTGTKMIIKLSS
jgi:NarL family two-component system sensor histidine kinase LiaS